MRLPLLLALALALPAHAELSPEVYKELQDKSPEALRVKVLSVDRAFTQGHTAKAELVQAKAEVLEVTRTATGLAPGKQIAMRYVHDPLAEGMAGPGPTPIVQGTAEYQAFLVAGERGVYAPAARRASFRQVAPPQAGAANEAPERVADFAGSTGYVGGLVLLLLALIGGVGAFLKGKRGATPKDDDPEAEMATQFRVAPVLQEPKER